VCFQQGSVGFTFCFVFCLFAGYNSIKRKIISGENPSKNKRKTMNMYSILPKEKENVKKKEVPQYLFIYLFIFF
jgi:hypothetical protein